MGLFKRCASCDRKKCRGHTTSASQADPTRVIRAYQSKKNMPGFGSRGKVKGRR